MAKLCEKHQYINVQETELSSSAKISDKSFQEKKNRILKLEPVIPYVLCTSFECFADE